jgi:hypothetical protein
MSLETFEQVPAFQPAIWSEGRLQNPEAPVRWSAKFMPPAVGDVIQINVYNQWKPAEVLGYFVQDGWLGCRCKCLEPPADFLKQNGGNVDCYSFGLEIKIA